MALDAFAPVQEIPQQLRLGRDLDSQSVFGGFERGQGMSDGTDRANPGQDRRYILVTPAPYQPFQEARSFKNVEAERRDSAVVVQLHRNPTMTFDPSQMLDLNLGAHECTPDMGAKVRNLGAILSRGMPFSPNMASAE